MQATTGDLKKAINELEADANFYGGSLAVGYFMTDWLALQARVQFLSGTGIGDTPNPANLDVSTYNVLYTGAVKLYPLALLTQNAGGQIQPYAIFGIGGQSTLVSVDFFGTGTTAFLLEVGGGLDLMFNSNFGVFGEVTYNYLNNTNFGFSETASAVGVNAGITYHF